MTFWFDKLFCFFFSLIFFFVSNGGDATQFSILFSFDTVSHLVRIKKNFERIFVPHLPREFCNLLFFALFIRTSHFNRFHHNLSCFCCYYYCRVYASID